VTSALLGHLFIDFRLSCSFSHKCQLLWLIPTLQLMFLHPWLAFLHFFALLVLLSCASAMLSHTSALLSHTLAAFQHLSLIAASAIQEQWLHLTGTSVKCIEPSCHGLPLKWTDTSVMTTTVRVY
jgi:hypothetical protein